jgi:CheY-like chemotaxis protein
MKTFHATILLVDDDEDFLLFVEKAFRKIGVDGVLHKVSDGAEAIAYMMGEGKFADRSLYPYPTFIMTDLKMPRADGFAVLEFLQTNPEWSIIPSVVFSGSSDLDDIKKAYRLGASSYHIKPHSFEELSQRIKTLHDYWVTCETPEVDKTGRQLPTTSSGKLGARFSQTGDGSDAASPHRLL